MKFIILLILCFSHLIFACPESFESTDAAGSTVVARPVRSVSNLRVTLSTPKEDLILLSRQDVQNLSPVETFFLLFNRNTPIEKVDFITATQVNELISRSRQLKKPKNRNVFHILVRIHIDKIEPENIPLIPPDIISRLVIYDIKRILPKQIPWFTEEQVYAFKKNQIENFSREQIQAFSPTQIMFFKEKIQYFLPEQIPWFTEEQVYAFKKNQIENFSREQIQAFSPTQIMFFKEKIQYFLPEQMEGFLPEQADVIFHSLYEHLNSEQRRILMRIVN